jgi:hypothetical protein
MINYENKYLKYKNKYLNYKLKGGASIEQLGIVLMMRQLIIKRLQDFSKIPSHNKSFELNDLITQYKIYLSHLNKAAHAEEDTTQQHPEENPYFDLTFTFNVNLQCVLYNILSHLQLNVRERHNSDILIPAIDPVIIATLTTKLQQRQLTRHEKMECPQIKLLAPTNVYQASPIQSRESSPPPRMIALDLSPVGETTPKAQHELKSRKALEEKKLRAIVLQMQELEGHRRQIESSIRNLEKEISQTKALLSRQRDTKIHSLRRIHEELSKANKELERLQSDDVRLTEESKSQASKPQASKTQASKPQASKQQASKHDDFPPLGLSTQGTTQKNLVENGKKLREVQNQIRQHSDNILLLEKELRDIENDLDLLK